VFLVGGTGLTGGTGNTFYARSVGASGGGMQLSSGLAATNEINFAFTLPPCTSVPASDLGTDVQINNDRGVVLLQTAGGGTVDLSSSGANTATLDLTGGAIVLQSKGSGATIELDGGSLKTEKLRPIAYHVPSAPNADSLDELGNTFLHASRDMIIETLDAQIHVRKGALLVLESSNHTARIYACSGPGDVRVQIGATSIELAPGNELVIADHKLTEEQVKKADGIGRRTKPAYSVSGSSFAALNDFSLVTLLANSNHLDSVKLANTPEKKAVLARITKMAAILHQLGTAKGRYQVQMSDSSLR
jgi:hypothetical protein